MKVTTWSRRFVGWILGLALFGCVLGLGWYFRPRERLLLEHATFVAKTDLWHNGERFNSDIDVHWLSNDDLLFCRFEGADGRQRVIYRRSAKTGQERKLPELTAARNSFETEVVDAQDVSPDGRWYVCSERWGACLLAEVNGRRQHTYPSVASEAYRSLFWMADGHHWLENYVLNGVSHRLVLHDTEHPDSSVSLPLGSKGELFGALETVVSAREAVAVVDPNRDSDGFETAPLTLPAPHVLTVTRMSLDARATPAAQYRVPVPGKTACYQLCVSPQGNRIAWQVTTLREDVVLLRLQHFLPFLHPTVKSRTEVWVCNIDGSQLHVIGNFPDPRMADIGYTDLSLQWLPDGKRLSFEYKDALYTVPAD